jgi:tetratricopeptide (TPR) repeat protein
LLVQQATAAYNQGDFREAERLVAQCNRAEKAGVANLDLVRCMALLGALLTAQSRFTDAEVILKRALAMGEQLNPRADYTGLVLSDLTDLYVKMSSGVAAEPYAVKAVDVFESSTSEFGRRQYPGALHYLGKVRKDQGRDGEAESLYGKALHLYEQVEGNMGPNVAAVAADLGELKRRQGKLLEAKPLLHRAFDIYQGERNGGHPFAIEPLISLADLDDSTGFDDESERELRLAISLIERQFGTDAPKLAKPLWKLGHVLARGKRLAEAEAALRRALEISRHTTLGRDNPDIATAANQYALFLWDQRRYQEALIMVQLMLEQHKSQPNVDLRDVATATLFRAQLQEALHDDDAAEASFKAAIDLRKRLYPAGDPAVEQVVRRYAEFRANARERVAPVRSTTD